MSRERSSTQNGEQSSFWALTGDTCYPITHTSAYCAVRSDSITDELTSPYSNPLPVNPCLHTKQETSYVCGSNWFHGNFSNLPNHWRKVEVRYRLGSPNGVANREDLVNWPTLVAGLADQVNGLIGTKTQLAVTFRELHKTWRMIRNPFSLLRKDWRHIVGKSPARELARRGANIWLERTYGWKPLFKDLQNFSESAANFTRSLEPLTPTKGSRHCSNRATYTDAQFPPSISDGEWNSAASSFKAAPWSQMYLGALPYHRFVYDAMVVKACVGCRDNGDPNRHVSRVRRFLSNWGIDPARDLLPTLWELTPYSFVVDWFINSQGIMDQARFNQSLDTLHQIGVHGVCYSVKTEYTFRVQMLPSWSWAFPGADSLYQVYPYVGASGQTNSILNGTPASVSRYARYVGFPSGHMNVFNNKGLTLSNLASATALLAQRYL